jgi:branched-chain amino acid transport system substrate-binding protein
MTVMTEAAYRPQPLRQALRAIGIGLAVFLAGCQSVVPRGAAPVAPPPPPTRPSTAPITGLPQDEARHRIALLVPVTGPNAAVGQSIANAANLALLDTGGKKLRITTYDTGMGAAAAAQRAIAEGNRLILGPLLAEDARAVAPAARAAGVPVLSFSNDLSVAGDGTFLLGFNPAQSIDRVVRYARSKGMTRFAALVPSGLYGDRGRRR